MEKSKPNYGEIVISFAIVSDELTRAAETWLSAKFAGYFKATGEGYFQNVAEPAARYTIATGIKTNLLFAMVTDFAVSYCKAGNQHSVYFRDKAGRPYIITAQGKFLAVD